MSLGFQEKDKLGEKKVIFFHFFLNRVQLKIGREFGHKLFADKYLKIIYEKLMSNPKPILKKI